MLFVIPPPAEGSMSPEALAALIERHGQTVLRTAALYLKDRARAEDVCQEVFLRLYRTNPAFQSPEHEKAFVLRVTINLCKDQLKSFWARRVVLDGEQEPPPGSDIADQVAADDQRRRLFTAVEGLPLPFRSVILLYYYQGMTTREIADTLGIPDATVRSRLKLAREKLSRTLKKGGEGE